MGVMLCHKEFLPSVLCDHSCSDNGITSHQQREPSPQASLVHLSTGATKPFFEGSNEKPGQCGAMMVESVKTAQKNDYLLQVHTKTRSLSQGVRAASY